LNEECDEGSGKEKETIYDLWVGQDNKEVPAEEATNLWRLMKHIAPGDSKKVTGTMDPGQGGAAWQKLCQSTQPSAAANTDRVLAQISKMKPAASHSEMREKVTEIEMVLMQAIQVGGETADSWKETWLRRVLDSMTKQMTALPHGKGYEERFVNSMDMMGDTMQTNIMKGGGGEEDWSGYEQPTPEQLAAMGKGPQLCWNCGQKGHISRDCPKGGGKAGGKKGCKYGRNADWSYKAALQKRLGR